MRRRAAPQFSLELPQSQKTELRPDVIKNVELIIDLEAGTMDSPFIETGPSFPGASSAAPPAAANKDLSSIADPTKSSSSSGRLFRVDASSLYVYRPGATESDDFFMSDRAGTDRMKGRSPTALGIPLPGRSHSSSCDVQTIPFEELEMGHHLGAGAQGSVRAVTFQGRNYAIKKINVTEALDRNQADVERQARKAAIVRELQMLANSGKRSNHVVALHNAYFRPGADDQEQCLHILMERMSLSLEDLRVLISKLPTGEVVKKTQEKLQKHMQGEATVLSGSKLTYQLSAEMTETLQTPLPEVLVSFIARHALHGLMHFHNHLRFIHTDIKPANLMFSEDFKTLKIADFGCSLEMATDGTAAVNNVLLGTKLYMSPERARVCGYGEDRTTGGKICAKSDIWALGVSLMELRAGIHPCHALREEFWNYAECLNLSNMLPPQNCSELFADFIQHALATDSEARWDAQKLLGHPFIKKYERVPEKSIADVIIALRHASVDYQKAELRRRVRSLISKATSTADPEKPRRAASAFWHNRVRVAGIIGDKPPNASDMEVFPSLC